MFNKSVPHFPILGTCKYVEANGRIDITFKLQCPTGFKRPSNIENHFTTTSN